VVRIDEIRNLPTAWRPQRRDGDVPPFLTVARRRAKRHFNRDEDRVLRLSGRADHEAGCIILGVGERIGFDVPNVPVGVMSASMSA
jgi:hypothetical protein